MKSLSNDVRIKASIDAATKDDLAKNRFRRLCRERTEKTPIADIAQQALRCQYRGMISSLPNEVLRHASVRGLEYAWPIKMIPQVIARCRDAGLLSLGGQLQFRMPSGTCECYWVQVDTMAQIDAELEWTVLVEQTASVGLTQFEKLSSDFNFEEEGRKAFSNSFSKLEAEGGDPREYACFVWYARNQNSGLRM